MSMRSERNELNIMNRQLIAFALAFACSGLSAAEFFVAPAGKDANPGTKEQPFATLERDDCQDH